MDDIALKINERNVRLFYRSSPGTEMQAKLEKIGSPLNFFLTPVGGIQNGMDVFGSFLEEKLGDSYQDFSSAVSGFGDSFRGLVALLEKEGTTGITKAVKEHFTALKCVAAAYKTLSTVPAPVPKGPEQAVQSTRAAWWYLINGMKEVINTANELYSPETSRKAVAGITPQGTISYGGRLVEAGA